MSAGLSTQSALGSTVRQVKGCHQCVGAKASVRAIAGATAVTRTNLFLIGPFLSLNEFAISLLICTAMNRKRAEIVVVLLALFPFELNNFADL